MMKKTNNTIFKKLVKLQKNAYCNYSSYPVSSIVVANDGKQYHGVNMENVSYGLTVCAERNAIASAVASGVRKIKEVHIYCGKQKSTFGSPCGACRQVISEFAIKDTKIVIWNSLGKNKTFKIEDLIPFTFNEEFFRKD